MAKIIQGFIREHPSGSPLPSVDVSILDNNTNLAIPAGGMIMSGGNPLVTDTNGYFMWSTELSPGPVRVEANINAGAEIKVRDGREMMQAGDVFISDIPKLLQLFDVGVFKGVGSEFQVSSISGQRAVRILPGAANMQGRLLQTDTNREITIAANTTLATRLDRIVLEQHVGGSYKGKQNIGVVQGTVDNTLPPTNADPNIFQMPIGHVAITLNATTVTVTDVRLYAGPLTLGAGIVQTVHLSQEVRDYIAANGFTGFTTKNAGTSIKTTTKSLNFRNGLQAVNGTGDEVHVELTTVPTAGKYSDDANWAAYGTAGSEVTLASVSVSVPKGTWLIQSMLTASARNNGNQGYVRFRLTGNGAPSGSAESTRAYRTVGGVSRQCVLTGRLKVTPTATTTYTVNARVKHESLDSSYVEDGNVHMVVT